MYQKPADIVLKCDKEALNRAGEVFKRELEQAKKQSGGVDKNKSTKVDK